MNLFSARVALRPRSLTEVLDLAVPLCAQNRRLLGKLSLLTLLPLAAAAALLRIGRGWVWLQLWALLLPAAFLLQGLFTVAFGEALFRPSEQIRTGAVLARFLRRLPAFVTGQLVRWLLLLLSASIIFPLILVAPGWLFVTEVLLLEASPLTAASRRSRALAAEQWGSSFGLWLATLTLPLLTAVLAELLGGMLVREVLQLGQPLGNLWHDGGSGFAVLGLLVGTPCAAAARFLGYINVRTRSEGWDIQLRFVSWSQTPARAQERSA